MAHGIIPPFSNYLICENFLLKTHFGTPITEDIFLLGEASNGVLVPWENADELQKLIMKAYSLYLSAGYAQLRSENLENSVESNSILALLLGVVLDIEGAGELISILLPSLKNASNPTWIPLVQGALRLRIQYIEEEIGALIKMGAKDINGFVQECNGIEKLERLLYLA